MGKASPYRGKRWPIGLLAIALLLPALPAEGRAGMGRVPPGEWTGSIVVDLDLTGGTVVGNGEFTLTADKNGRVAGVLSFGADWNGRGVIGGDTTDASISYAAENWDLSGDGALSSNALVFEASGDLASMGDIVVTQNGQPNPFGLDGVQPESATITFTDVTCTSMSGTFDTDNFGIDGAPLGGPAMVGSMIALPSPTDEVVSLLDLLFETRAALAEAIADGDSEQMIPLFTTIVGLLQQLVNDVEANVLCGRPQRDFFGRGGPFFEWAAEEGRRMIAFADRKIGLFTADDIIDIGWLAANVGTFNGAAGAQAFEQLERAFLAKTVEAIEADDKATQEELNKAACQLGLPICDWAAP